MRRNEVGRGLWGVALMVAMITAAGACKRRAERAAPASSAASSESTNALAVDTPPAPTFRLAPSRRTPMDGEPPTLKVVAPKPDAVVGEDVAIRLKVKGWQPGATGRHVHLIVDDLPFIAIRDASKPIALVPLLKEKLDVELREGRHFFRVFPSRASHESVKEGAPFAYQVFHYKKRINDKGTHKHAPLLTYNLPHGCYPVGKPILLDFYLTNTEIGRYGHRVQLSVDQSRPKAITKWVPHTIEGLTEGTHAVRLVLVDADGQPMRGQFNDVTRTITVAKACP